MSSFIKDLKNPKTGKTQKAWCIDDYYGTHRYGYFFRKDGTDADWEDFNIIQQESPSPYDIFNEDEI